MRKFLAPALFVCGGLAFLAAQQAVAQDGRSQEKRVPSPDPEPDEKNNKENGAVGVAIKKSRMAAQKALPRLLARSNLAVSKSSGPENHGSGPGAGGPALDNAVPEITLGLGDLLTIDSGPGGSLDSLFNRTPSAVRYPLGGNDSLKHASVLTELLGDKTTWAAVELDTSPISGRINIITSRSSTETGLPLSAYRIINVPTLDEMFIFYKHKDENMMIPILGDDELKLEAGKPMKAKDVFPRLKQQAKEVKTGAPG